MKESQTRLLLKEKLQFYLFERDTSTCYWIKKLCSMLGLIIEGTVTNLSVDKEKIEIVMICAHAQM